MGPQMGPKWAQTKMGPQKGPKMGPWVWDMPNLDMGHAQPGMGHAQPGMGHAQPGMGHAQPPWSMDMPNQWARTAQGPTNGPERPWQLSSS